MTVIVVVLFVSGVICCGWLGRKRWLDRTADPNYWPSKPSHQNIVLRTRRYLKLRGWKILAPYDWRGIFVRAEKEGLALDLYVFDPETLSQRTMMLHGIIENQQYTPQLLGILTFEEPDPDLLGDAERNGIYFITPRQLRDAEEIVRTAASRRKEILAEREAIARIAEPDVVVASNEKLKQ